MQHTRALLLDKNYIALSVVSWKKAIKLMVKGKAEAIETDQVIRVRTSTGFYNIPTVIRLLVSIPWKAHVTKTRFSRRNVMLRDSFECQYCSTKVGKNATIDHVLPRSRGGISEYTNCVTCCTKCNNAKGDMTPKEAGMSLKHKPRVPSLSVSNKSLLEESPASWKDYLIGLID